MTDLEILASCINEADNIQVPTKYAETISLPISNISNKLKLLYKAIAQQYENNKAMAEASAEAPAEAEVIEEEAPEEPGE